MKRKLITIIIILFLLALATPAQAQIEPIETGCDPAWICPYKLYVPFVVQNGRETVSVQR